MDNKKNANRFLMFARKNIIEHKKTLTYVIGGYLGLTFVLGLWSGWTGGTPGEILSSFYVLLAMLVCSVAASKMMFDLTSKQGRISLLMTPAGAADKFLVRLIGVLPGMLLLVIAGYFTNTYGCILGYGFTYDVWPGMYIPSLPSGNNTELAAFGVAMSFILLGESMFIFGAAAWPRLSFLKTLGIMIVLQIAMSMIAVTISMSNILENIKIEIYDENLFLWSAASVTIVIAVALSYFSYLKFKRTTVI